MLTRIKKPKQRWLDLAPGDTVDGPAIVEQSDTTTLVEPWVGLRGTWIAAPDWRVTAAAAATGFGTNGGAWGWNGRVVVSYLVTKWLDLSLGYFALQTSMPSGTTGLREPRSLNLLSYGPIVAVGFRF